MHIYEQVDIMASPFDVALINQNLARLAEAGRRQLERDAVAPERQRLAFALDMRHKGQINEVEIALPAEQIGEGDLRTLAERFYQRYERLYGQGSSFRGTPLEIVTFRVRATAQTPRPHLKEASAPTERISARAKRAPRRIYWADLQRQEETPIFDGAHLRPGNRIVGPAVIETNATTVVVHPGRTLAVDGFGNFEITFGQVGSP
jgi:N-methylhydantoinase A